MPKYNVPKTEATIYEALTHMSPDDALDITAHDLAQSLALTKEQYFAIQSVIAAAENSYNSSTLEAAATVREWLWTQDWKD